VPRRGFNCDYVASRKAVTGAVAKKLFAAVFEPDFHTFKSLLASGQFHVRQPVEYIQFVAASGAA
jgi:hypothetical protein